MQINRLIESYILVFYKVEEKNQGSDAKKSSMLYSFFDSVTKNVVGKNKIEREDLEPALVSMKAKLMERNVAEDIATK